MNGVVNSPQFKYLPGVERSSNVYIVLYGIVSEEVCVFTRKLVT